MVTRVSNGRLRVGILGSGGIGKRHALAVQALPDQLELVAACGRDEAKTEAFAGTFGIKAYTDRERMLDESDLDILIVALPPFAHTDEVESAAGRGIHLLLEKPIALTLEDADRMVDAANKAGIRTQVGFMYRFGTAVEEWRRRAQAGQTGPISLFAGRYHCNALHAPWWRSKDKSGGQLAEQVIHLFDIVRHLMGEPETIYARTANLFHRDVPGYDVEDVSAVVMGFKDGSIATLNATNTAIPGRWTKEWHLVARDVTAHFEDFNKATFTRTAGEVVEEKIEDTRDVFVAQLADLVQAIRAGRPARTPIEEGRKSLALAIGARRASEEGREIAL